MKRCSKCKETKPNTEFNKNKKQKDGHHNWCRGCEKARYQQEKTEILEQKKDYYNKNTTRLREKQKNYRLGKLDEHAERGHTYNRTMRGKYSSLIKRAKQGNIQLELTYEQFCVLRTLPCVYDGEPLPETSSGLDRKDNTKGYTVDNVVPCCTECNRMKNRYLSYDEMLLIWAIRKGKIPKPVI